MVDIVEDVETLYPFHDERSAAWLRRATAGREIGSLRCVIVQPGTSSADAVIDSEFDYSSGEPARLTLRDEGVDVTSGRQTYTPYVFHHPGLRQPPHHIEFGHLAAEQGTTTPEASPTDTGQQGSNPVE